MISDQGVEQTSLFDGCCQPGDWVETYGRRLMFDELSCYVGKLVVLDMSTEHAEWFKAGRLEKVIHCHGSARVVVFNGKAQRSFRDRRWIDGPESMSGWIYEIGGEDGNAKENP